MALTSLPLIVIVAPANSPVSDEAAVIVVVALSPILSKPEVGAMVTLAMAGRLASTPGRLPALAVVNAAELFPAASRICRFTGKPDESGKSESPSLTVYTT